MGNTAMSNESIYQAALITEQRALDGHTQAIDLLQRLLDSMGDDPLLVQTKTNLQKILENPEVITDEVFNNIMSKTGEILDTNYDQQVQEVLGAARAKGVSGPALQVTLQKAKQARAVAMASAYREAIIARSESGLKTNMDAITSATNLLNQLFTNQRATSQDLATVMRETVPAPFRNYGVDEVQSADPAAGGGGGGAGGSTGMQSGQPSPYSLGDVSKSMAADQAAAEEQAARAADLANAKSEAEFRDYWAKWGANGSAAQKAADKAIAGKTVQTPAAVPGTPGAPVSLTAEERGPASGTGTFEINGKQYTMDAQGKIQAVDYGSYDTVARTLPQGVITPNANPLSPASTQRSSDGYDVSSSVLAAQKDSAMQSDIMSQVKTAMAPLSNTGYQIQNNFTPSQPISVLPTVDYGQTLGSAYAPAGQSYQESTIKSGGTSISAGGGGNEATRGAALVSTYGAPAVIGTTAGYGVRNTGIAPGSVSAGDKLSDIYDSNTGYRTSAAPAAKTQDPIWAGGKYNSEIAAMYAAGTQNTPENQAKIKAALASDPKLIVTSAGPGVRHA